MKRIEAIRIGIIDTARIAEITIARGVVVGVVDEIDVTNAATEKMLDGETIMIAGEKKMIFTIAGITKSTDTGIVAEVVAAREMVQEKRIRMQLPRRPVDAANGILIARERVINVVVATVLLLVRIVMECYPTGREGAGIHRESADVPVKRAKEPIGKKMLIKEKRKKEVISGDQIKAVKRRTMESESRAMGKNGLPDGRTRQGSEGVL